MNPEKENRDDSDSSSTAENSAETSETESTAAPSAPARAVISDSSSTDENSAATSETESTAAASAPASAGVAPAAEIVSNELKSDAPAHRREDRRNWVQNVNETCEYIGKISRDKKLHFRSSDKVTTRLLIGAFLLAVGFAALPFFEMNAVAAFAYVLADILLLGAIVVFVVSRFGIIRAMEPRHALVCWHLMVGTGLLALVIGFNVVATVVLFMMRERLQLLFPGG